MRILALPRDPNPYQELLYAQVRRAGVPVAYAGGLTPSRSLNLLLLPLELLARRLGGFGVLHVHWVFGFTPPGAGRIPGVRRLAQGWFALVLGVARLVGMRVVWTAHNVLPHERVFADDAAARRRLVGASDLVIAHSDSALEALAGLGASPRSATIVPPGPFSDADPSLLRPPGAGEGPRTVVFFGKILPYKGVTDLLCAALALDPATDLRIVVAGPCPDPALESRLRSLARHASGRVELRIGFVPDEEVEALMAAADVVALPFRAITTSSSALLALEHGRPVLVPDLAAFGDLPDGPVVRYDRTTEGLRAALTEIAEMDPPELALRGEAAGGLVGEHTWEGAASATLDGLRAAAAVPVGGPRALIGAAVSRVGGDALYKGSLLLLLNTVLLSIFGFASWAVATHAYPSSAVGAFSAVTAAVNLLATVAALGLPNTLMRHLARSEHPRRLVSGVLLAVTSLGAAACVIVTVLLGPHVPAGMHLPRHASGNGLVVGLVVVTSASAATDAGLVALQRTRDVLLKNVAGGVVKVAAVAPLAAFGSAGLIVAFGLGALVATALGVLALWRALPPATAGPGALALLRRHASFSVGNYVGTIFGILPLSVIPAIVLASRGAAEAAWFSVAFLIVSFLNFVPSTASQALFAEASRGGDVRREARKALRLVYGLLAGPVAVVVVAAPLLLRVFGGAYGAHASGALRMLALGTLFAAGNYLLDVLFAASDRVRTYIVVNAANAVLVLIGVVLLLPRGLTWAAAGWAGAQAAALAVALVALAVTGVGRDAPAAAARERRPRPRRRGPAETRRELLRSRV